EIIRYTKIKDGSLVEFQRGVLGPSDASQWHGGPAPPSAHDAGAPLIDQRAFAPALWRIASPDGEFRAFDSTERLREAGSLAVAAATSGESDARKAQAAGLPEEAPGPPPIHGSAHGG